MPVNLKAHRERTVTCEVNLGQDEAGTDEVLTLKLKPNRLTVKRYRALLDEERKRASRAKARRAELEQQVEAGTLAAEEVDDLVLPDDPEERALAMLGMQTGSLAMLEVMADWDAVDDDGQPVPLTAQALADLDVESLKAIFEAVNGAINPNPTAASASNGSSPTQEPSGT